MSLAQLLGETPSDSESSETATSSSETDSDSESRAEGEKPKSSGSSSETSSDSSSESDLDEKPRREKPVNSASDDEQDREQDRKPADKPEYLPIVPYVELEPFPTVKQENPRPNKPAAKEHEFIDSLCELLDTAELSDTEDHKAAVLPPHPHRLADNGGNAVHVHVHVPVSTLSPPPFGAPNNPPSPKADRVPIIIIPNPMIPDQQQPNQHSQKPSQPNQNQQQNSAPANILPLPSRQQGNSSSTSTSSYRQPRYFRSSSPKNGNGIKVPVIDPKDVKHEEQKAAEQRAQPICMKDVSSGANFTAPSIIAGLVSAIFLLSF